MPKIKRDVRVGKGFKSQRTYVFAHSLICHLAASHWPPGDSDVTVLFLGNWLISFERNWRRIWLWTDRAWRDDNNGGI